VAQKGFGGVRVRTGHGKSWNLLFEFPGLKKSRNLRGHGKAIPSFSSKHGHMTEKDVLTWAQT